MHSTPTTERLWSCVKQGLDPPTSVGSSDCLMLIALGLLRLPHAYLLDCSDCLMLISWTAPIASCLSLGLLRSPHTYLLDCSDCLMLISWTAPIASCLSLGLLRLPHAQSSQLALRCSARSPSRPPQDLNAVSPTAFSDLFGLDFLRNRTKRDAFRPHGVSRNEFRRYKIDLKSGAITFTRARLTDPTGRTFALASALPRINYEHFNGRPACSAWALDQGFAGDCSKFEDWALLKAELCNESAPLRTWEAAQQWPSEPVFVPQPGAAAEDAGVLLSPTLDGSSGRSYLLVLNASTMKHVAKVWAPEGYVIPFGFHGQFYRDQT